MARAIFSRYPPHYRELRIVVADRARHSLYPLCDGLHPPPQLQKVNRVSTVTEDTAPTTGPAQGHYAFTFPQMHDIFGTREPPYLLPEAVGAGVRADEVEHANKLPHPLPLWSHHREPTPSGTARQNDAQAAALPQ